MPLKTNRFTISLFAVILLEGFVVLAAEILAIRQMIPFVGSGSDTVAIIIAAVLMPLAFGYHAGGRYRQQRVHLRKPSIRRKLIRNLLGAQAILILGLSYVSIGFFFELLMALGIENRWLQTTFYSLLFLVVPTYLLGQTVPLIANYWQKQQLSAITGLILSVSTIGSFLGATFTTLVVMALLGVNYAVMLVGILLTVLVVILNKWRRPLPYLVTGMLLYVGCGLNTDRVLASLNIIEANRYNNIQLAKLKGGSERHLILNNSYSSKITDNGLRHAYIEKAEQIYFAGAPKDSPLSILVIGSGGFTFGYHDPKNHYDFVDIDDRLQAVAEQEFLKRPLGANVSFYPLPARAFLKQNRRQYDLIFLDAFQGVVKIPEHLTTAEFFQQVRHALKPDGVVMANFIISPTYEDAFSRHLDNTFRHVFPHLISLPVLDSAVFGEKRGVLTNVLYLYKNHQGEPANSSIIYTDNINRQFIDRPRRTS